MFFVRAGLGRFRGGNNTFESAPINQLQETIEPLTQDDGTFLEMYLRKSRKHSAEKEVRGEIILRDNQTVARSLKKEREEELEVLQQRAPVRAIAPEKNHGGAGIFQ